LEAYEDGPDPRVATAFEEKKNRLVIDIILDPPKNVQLVPHVESDMQALSQLLDLLTSIMVLIWPVLGSVWLSYGFGDASGNGQGANSTGIGQPTHIQLMCGWPLDSTETLPPDVLLSLTRLAGEGRMADLKIILGWLLYSHLLLIALAEEKFVCWTEDLLEMIKNKKCLTPDFRDLSRSTGTH
jgi:hypothetical protein